MISYCQIETEYIKYFRQRYLWQSPFLIKKNTSEYLVQAVATLLVELIFLPARASEQGIVIGLVSVYIYVIKKNCN